MRRLCTSCLVAGNLAPYEHDCHHQTSRNIFSTHREGAVRLIKLKREPLPDGCSRTTGLSAR